MTWLWLDDLRKPPDDDWTWVKTVDDAIVLMEAGDVTVASLDNDLGEGVREGRTLVYWMAENDRWPLEVLDVHSQNAVASEYMIKMIERYAPFTRYALFPYFYREDS